MFRKLRNRLILINLGITSLIIVVVFSIIYLSSTHLADNRPPIPNDNHNYPGEVEDFIEFSIKTEKENAAKQLLTTLIISGVAIELMVALISYLLAEEAIKPVREAYETQKIFIANASHEIKTPLAAILANLEAADITGNKWISNIEKETTKLTMLNNSLLAQARTDLTTDPRKEDTDLKKLTTSVIKSFEPRLKSKKLDTNIASITLKNFNATDFKEILEILLDNAIKYSNKKIKLTLTRDTLSITNDGTTISAENLPHLFERFYQTDKSSEGVGLGLSIAKSLAERNHWTLTATSKSDTTFTLKI